LLLAILLFLLGLAILFFIGFLTFGLLHRIQIEKQEGNLRKFWFWLSNRCQFRVLGVLNITISLVPLLN
jgi:hypothetical protein